MATHIVNGNPDHYLRDDLPSDAAAGDHAVVVYPERPPLAPRVQLHAFTGEDWTDVGTVDPKQVR